MFTRFTRIVAARRALRANPSEAFSTVRPISGSTTKSGMRALVRLLPIAVVVGLLVGGCSPSPSPIPLSALAVSSHSAMSARSAMSALNPILCQPPSLEHCYTEAQMQDYLIEVAIPAVERFIRDTYSNMPLPKFAYIPDGQTGRACGGQVDDMAYEYCPSDDTVYIGQKMEWTLYDQFGAVAPVLVLAHEFGHHIQATVGVPEPADSAELVQHENQADCIAGAWARWADQQRMIQYPGDLEYMDVLMTAIVEWHGGGAANGPNQTHGSASDRVRAFELGDSSGLPACNDYYPATPIVTQRG